MYLDMKTILVVTTLLVVALANPHPVTLDQEWNEYKQSFGKFYTSEKEDLRRLQVYLETKRTVEEHNRKYERRETSYTMGINQFADWFPEELRRLNGFDAKKLEAKEVVDFPEQLDVPVEIDWSKKGAVTAVKDQGSCNCGYAFGAVGALEGLMFKTNKTITNLSVQELVDCSGDFGNSGCERGMAYDCFRYVVDRKGISTDKSYPYEAKNGTCRAKSGTLGTTCNDYVMLPASEDVLKTTVGSFGPVSVSFGVSKEFLLYKDGIFNGSCSDNVNHEMLAVGYGKDPKTKQDFWLVKNSFGVKWGMKGYARIARGVEQCWIHMWNSHPNIKK